jgi:hypothetical protein
MKAYEFSAKVTADGQLEFPATLLKPLMNNQQVRVIVLVDENPEIEGNPDEEDASWQSFAVDRFFADYSDADAIYDKS